jgi:hypothetical protein
MQSVIGGISSIGGIIVRRLKIKDDGGGDGASTWGQDGSAEPCRQPTGT